MFFLTPSFLWALLGLGVPVAIHLWSKKQGKNLKVGSIKFLQESDSRKSRSIKINEFWLLLLRMLLITVLVLILAEPRLNSKTKNSSITYIVETSLLNSPEVKVLVDSLHAQAEIRFLKPNFPEYNSEISKTDSSEVPNYWQLSRDMQNLNTDSIVVFTNAYLSGIKGKRPEISKQINWINLNFNQTLTKSIGILKNEDKAELISAISNAEVFKLKKEMKAPNLENSETIPIIEKDSLFICMYAEEKFQTEANYLNSSLLAISKYLNHPISIKKLTTLDSLNSTTNELWIWLSDKPAPVTQSKLLRFQENEMAHSLIEQGNSIDEYYLTTKLNSELIVQQHLGEQLIKILDLYPEIEEKTKLYDRRVMNLELLKPNFKVNSEQNKREKSKDVSKYLWIILMLIVVSERIMSKYRKQ